MHERYRGGLSAAEFGLVDYTARLQLPKFIDS